MIRYELDGQIAWVTIDRPDSKNALSPAANRDLRAAVERAESEARVAVVTATGEDAFCAGSDLEALETIYETGDTAEFVQAEFDLYRRIETLDIPVIAAVNGLAYGGGFELVAVCDLAIAVETAEFALPETRLGLTPGVALDRATALVGRKRLLELALTSEPIDAVTARDWGVINRVVDRSQLRPTTREIANAIADAPPHAVRAVKRTVNEELDASVSYQRSVDRLTALLAEPETQSRLDAFFAPSADENQ